MTMVKSDRVSWLTIANGEGDDATVSITIKRFTTSLQEFAVSWTIASEEEGRDIEGSFSAATDQIVNAFDRSRREPYRDFWFIRVGPYLAIGISNPERTLGSRQPVSILITDAIEEAVDALTGLFSV